MSASNESKGPTLLFLLLWFGLANDPVTSEYAFLLALGLLLVGWFGLRVIGSAIRRLGGPAWIVLGKLVIALGFLMVLLPSGPGVAITWAWGVGLPILMLAMAARWGFDRVPPLVKDWSRPALLAVLVCAAIANFALSLRMGDMVLTALLSTVLLTALQAVPAYYGWQLGASARRGEHDARFAHSDDLRRRGFANDL